MGKGQRTLACGVQPEVYDQYRALLPIGADGEPVSINAHLSGLVQAFIDGSMYPQRWVTSAPLDATASGGADLEAFAHQVARATSVPAEVLMGATASSVAVLERAELEPVSDPGCMHPKALLHREGRQVVCRCGAPVNR